MHPIDWLVMLIVLLLIVGYGVYKTRNINSAESYLLGDKDLPWWTIGLSIMATQASAITFLSTPGQAFEEGMDFAQFYIGLPVAMILLSIFVLPIYYKLNVYTAYEYLEGRFDLKTRSLTALFFLLQRGLSAGLTIYAPSIILSNILGWNLDLTIICTGVLVVFYTVMGGTKAVSVTQKQQMIVILLGIFIAAIILVFQFPEDVRLIDAVNVAGKLDKLEILNFEFDLNKKYTFWTGMIGGTFLFLSYFGTDQSQVQRYLSGKSLTESRLGLLFNGVIKLPMQLFILFVGILVFIFFQFQKPPLHFNEANVRVLEGTEYQSQYKEVEDQFAINFDQKQVAIRQLIAAVNAENESNITSAQGSVQRLITEEQQLKTTADDLILSAAKSKDIKVNKKDGDYVFLTFVMNYLPRGLIGLLIAVIFSAAMSSVASEINSLATTSIVDFYKRSFVQGRSDKHYLSASKWMTIAWGVVALFFAKFASLFDNLIEMVNIIGSLFYGVILGVFVVAFFLKWVRGTAVFIAAIISEICIILISKASELSFMSWMPDIAYLWWVPIGCVLVMVISMLIQMGLPRVQKTQS